MIPRFAEDSDNNNNHRPAPAGITTPALATKQAAITAAAAMRRKSLRSLGVPTPTGAAAVPPTPTRVTETAAISPPDPTDGSYGINGYVVLDTIGRGAQGEVFVAFDSATGELRAVKSVPKPPQAVALAMAQSTDSAAMDGPARPRALPTSTRAGALPFALARDRQRRQRLAREVAIMKRCRHPNIVRLYEVIDDPSHDRMYLVMQHVEHGSIVTLRPDGTVDPAAGPGLAAAMSGARFPAMPSLGGPINPVELVHYAEQIVSGLQYLHRRGILHRDLKPDNILLGAHDTVYLSDFGVASIDKEDAGGGGGGGIPRRAGLFGGTPAFMAPELHSDAAAPAPTAAVDVWALGVMFYALLYGRLPWAAARDGGNLAALVAEIIGDGSAGVGLPPTGPWPATPTSDASTYHRQAGRKAHPPRDSLLPVPLDEDASTSQRPGEVFPPPASSVVAAHRPPQPTSAQPPASVSSSDDDDDDDDGALATEWARLLRTMLVRDASRRLCLDDVAQRLGDLRAAVDSRFVASSTMHVNTP